VPGLFVCKSRECSQEAWSAIVVAKLSEDFTAVFGSASPHTARLAISFAWKKSTFSIVKPNALGRGVANVTFRERGEHFAPPVYVRSNVR
jgi:hypothetical protein